MAAAEESKHFFNMKINLSKLLLLMLCKANILINYVRFKYASKLIHN